MNIPRTYRLIAFILFVLIAFAQPTTAAGYSDTSDRARVACHSENTSIVLLTFGQSISANHGATNYTPHGDVVNFNTNDGQCYLAKDPLLGATSNPSGNSGSIWAGSVTSSCGPPFGSVVSSLRSHKGARVWLIGLPVVVGSR